MCQLWQMCWIKPSKSNTEKQQEGEWFRIRPRWGEGGLPSCFYFHVLPVTGTKGQRWAIPPPAPPSGAAKGRCSCTGNIFALEWPREGQFIKADFIMKGTGEAGGTGSLIYCTRGFSGPLIALQSLCVKCAARFSSFRSVLRFLFLPSSNAAVWTLSVRFKMI